MSAPFSKTVVRHPLLDPFCESAGLADLFAWPDAESQQMAEERNVLVAAVDNFEAIMRPNVWLSKATMGRMAMVNAKGTSEGQCIYKRCSVQVRERDTYLYPIHVRGAVRHLSF